MNPQKHKINKHKMTEMLKKNKVLATQGYSPL